MLSGTYTVKFVLAAIWGNRAEELELHVRQKQEIQADDFILKEIACPICLDVLQNTVTAIDCLHRFCDACLNAAMKKGIKECPVCRTPIISKRYLRADKGMDALIAKILKR